jgi:hypothetical protein
VQDSRFSGLNAVLVQSLKQASAGRARTGFSARGASFSRSGVFVFLAACSSEFPVEWRLGSRVGIKAPMVRTGFLGFGSLMLWLYCKDRT